MRGAPGTTIKLTIGRPDIAPFVVEITREVITITSAKGLIVSDGIGYLRIAQFQRPTAEVVEKIIANLVRKNEGDLDSLIIDLRNNPGGLLDSSIDISNLFIDEPGIVVYTEGRTPTSNMSFPTKPGDILNGAPIVVLMNVGSASASEIVAGALQDHKRAIIMGEESFGKGSVQSMMSLQDGYGLKLTTARYFTPSGRSIQAKGISPDIALDNISLKDEDEEEESIDFSSQEKDLKNALSAQDEDETKPEDTSESKSDSTEVDTLGSQDEVNPTELTPEEILESQDKIAAERDQEFIDLLLEDYYVHEAVNVLKALKIYNK
jgi:carboxyl-terminal processing protease